LTFVVGGVCSGLGVWVNASMVSVILHLLLLGPVVVNEITVGCALSLNRGLKRMVILHRLLLNLIVHVRLVSFRKRFDTRSTDAREHVGRQAVPLIFVHVCDQLVNRRYWSLLVSTL